MLDQKEKCEGYITRNQRPAKIPNQLGFLKFYVGYAGRCTCLPALTHQSNIFGTRAKLWRMKLYQIFLQAPK